ncbi:MAG: molybdate ABC transporter substrate-binding protein [Alphaproteobacteria bacterium]
MLNRRWILAGLLTAVAAAAAPPPAAAQGEIVVFAAASMKNALDDAAAAWKAAGGAPTKISYAASSALARQIEQGAPAAMFISADLDWMDYVQQRDLMRPQTRANLLGNAIVLIAPRDSKAEINLVKGADVAALLGPSGRIAMGDVRAVPAGKYGKAALEALGAWPVVEARVAQAENVRAALLLVARGETPLGVVYATDAAAEPNVRVVAAFPADSHPPIVYPVALTKTAPTSAAAFLDYLQSAKARPFFEKQGFTVLK